MPYFLSLSVNSVIVLFYQLAVSDNIHCLVPMSLMSMLTSAGRPESASYCAQNRLSRLDHVRVCPRLGQQSLIVYRSDSSLTAYYAALTVTMVCCVLWSCLVYGSA